MSLRPIDRTMLGEWIRGLRTFADRVGVAVRRRAVLSRMKKADVVLASPRFGSLSPIALMYRLLLGSHYVHSMLYVGGGRMLHTTTRHGVVVARMPRKVFDRNRYAIYRARGLMTVLERVFRNFKFELPSTAVKSFEVTTDTVADPETSLKDLIKENEHAQRGVMTQDVEAFAERFSLEHDITLNFESDAIDALIDSAVESDKAIRTVCEEKFRDFQHGLKIVSRNTEEDAFTITKAIVGNPDKELSRMVVDSFETAKTKAEENMEAKSEEDE